MTERLPLRLHRQRQLTSVGRGEVLASTTRHFYHLAAIAPVGHAGCGRGVVSPSGMMDGGVGAVRDTLTTLVSSDAAIMSSSVKYASGFTDHSARRRARHPPWAIELASGGYGESARGHPRAPARRRGGRRHADGGARLAYLNIVGDLARRFPLRSPPTTSPVITPWSRPPPTGLRSTSARWCSRLARHPPHRRRYYHHLPRPSCAGRGLAVAPVHGGRSSTPDLRSFAGWSTSARARVWGGSAGLRYSYAGASNHTSPTPMAEVHRLRRFLFKLILGHASPIVIEAVSTAAAKGRRTARALCRGGHARRIVLINTVPSSDASVWAHPVLWRSSQPSGSRVEPRSRHHGDHHCCHGRADYLLHRCTAQVSPPSARHRRLASRRLQRPRPAVCPRRPAAFRSLMTERRHQIAAVVVEPSLPTTAAAPIAWVRCGRPQRAAERIHAHLRRGHHGLPT